MPPAVSTRLRRILVGTLVAACVVAIALVWRYESRPSERDLHTLEAEVDRLVRHIRAHDVGTWLAVEGGPHEQGPKAAEQEARHRRILADFDKLGHLTSFSFEDLVVTVAGDHATVRYRLQFQAQDWKPMPAGGRLEFVRSGRSWTLHDHAFDRVPQNQPSAGLDQSGAAVSVTRTRRELAETRSIATRYTSPGTRLLNDALSSARGSAS
jgi:hypothetical protein